MHGRSSRCVSVGCWHRHRLGGRVIELSEMIRELRREFTAAMAEGDGERVRFELGPVEVEASVTVSKEAGAMRGCAS
ncbi:trypco2 family protein [Streptomyces sp. NPDC058469]|uniref:trypco2 family protein n=1 Tax=Streptomyces sp. NPDC058469 TaxID=3346514 RepID=UPI003660A2FC